MEQLGINDIFVEHGTQDELFKMLGLDAEGIAQELRLLIKG